MLSKRAFLTFAEETQPTRKRFEEEISFLPSEKVDMLRNVHVFFREVKLEDLPFQITVCFHDYAFGRIGYYDLGYSDFETAHQDFKQICEEVREIREQVEYNMLSSYDIEKLCRAKIEAVLTNATVFNSTYGLKSNSR